MFFINTEELRKQAGDLKEYKRKYMQLIPTLEEVLIWIQKNEFQDAEPIITTMEQQKKALEEQKNDIQLLSEGLLRICDRYDSSEYKIVDAAEKVPAITAYIGELDLEYVRKRAYLYEDLQVI